MVFDHFKPDEFFQYLLDNGCVQYTDRYIKDDNVIVYKNGNNIVPIQLRKAYYPTYVCLICDEIGIKPPKNLAKLKAQIDLLLKKSKQL